MKKLTSLFIAIVFAATIALAVINTAASTAKQANDNSYATICPIPPPPPPSKATNIRR